MDYLILFLFSGADIKGALSYRKTRKKQNEQNIEDILDGRLYKAHFDDDGYSKAQMSIQK